MDLEQRRRTIKNYYIQQENLEASKRMLNTELNSKLNHKIKLDADMKSTSARLRSMSATLADMDEYFNSKYIVDFFQYLETGVEDYKYSDKEYSDKTAEYSHIKADMEDSEMLLAKITDEIGRLQASLGSAKEQMKVIDNLISHNCHHYEVYDYSDLGDWFKVTVFHTLIQRTNEISLIKQYSYDSINRVMYELREDKDDRVVADSLANVIMQFIQ